MDIKPAPATGNTIHQPSTRQRRSNGAAAFGKTAALTHKASAADKGWQKERFRDSATNWRHDVTHLAHSGDSHVCVQR